MSFDFFIGNKLAIGMLKKSLESKRVASAYLLHGPDGVGKNLAAREFAKALVCEKGGIDACDACSSCRRVDTGNHPDVHWYKPVGKARLVKIATVRDMIEQTGLKPFEAPWKVFILLEADRMRVESQNAVLKTLEEPPGQSALLLVSSNPAALLPTIVSRCQDIPFLPIPRDELEDAIAEKWGLDKEKSRLVASLSAGSLGSAKRLLDRENLNRRQALLNLLKDPRQVSFHVVQETAQAVEKELREMSRTHTAQKEKQLKAMAKALTAAQLDELLEEVKAEVDSEVRQEAEDTLNILAFWYRDLLVVKEGASAGLVTNLDMMEALQTVAAGMSTDEILRRLQAVEQARQAIALNLSLTLCLQMVFLSGKQGTAAHLS
jgi:DNA polymerase-3 subunit delta'